MSNKKQWPNKSDGTIGGHVLAGEFGREALIRETKEEFGIDIDDCDIKYLIGSTSIAVSYTHLFFYLLILWI